MKRLNLFRTACLGLFFLCSGCNGDVMSKADIEKIISENLKPGAENQKIIDFLENQNWVYDFDRYVGRYQARNPDEDDLPQVRGRNQIYIYVNDKKEFVRAEIEKVFNSL